VRLVLLRAAVVPGPATSFTGVPLSASISLLTATFCVAGRGSSGDNRAAILSECLIINVPMMASVMALMAIL
jgi:hypothetical protein